MNQKDRSNVSFLYRSAVSLAEEGYDGSKSNRYDYITAVGGTLYVTPVLRIADGGAIGLANPKIYNITSETLRDVFGIEIPDDKAKKWNTTISFKQNHCNYYGLNYYIVDYIKEYTAATSPELGVFIDKKWYDTILSKNPASLKALMQHEYGHVLQYKSVGSDIYWGVIAPLSMISALEIGGHNHQSYFIEVDANYKANVFFGNDASTKFGSSQYPTSLSRNSFQLFK